MPSEIVGKRILVDIREFDRALKLRCARNFSGVIVEHGEFGLAIRRDDTGEFERLIVDAEDLEHADPGEYWLRTTGALILQPDLIAEWVQYDALPGHSTLKLEEG